MKTLSVLLASASLSACVGYGPGAYEAPYPHGAYNSPYYGPYVVDPGYHYGPVAPYGYAWGGYGYGYGSDYHGPRPRGPRPGSGDQGGDRPPRPGPVFREGGGSGWSPADHYGSGGGGGGASPVGGGSGWSPNQR